MIKLLTALTSLHLLLLCSCATLTEEERFTREDKRIQAREEFYLQKDYCRRMGGTIQVRLRTLGKLGNYSYNDYKSARCVKRSGPGINTVL